MEKKYIICFGEVLWDMLPDGKILGGAPLNVLFHAQNNGLSGDIITAIGDDALGKEIYQEMHSLNLSVDLVQEIKDVKTGIAAVSLDKNGTASYELVQPVSYDMLQLTESNLQAMNRCDAFVYGSLANRSEKSFLTLSSLLESQKENKNIIRVFDINLRPPHYKMETIDFLLEQANIVKLNEEELEIVAAHHQLEGERFSLMKKMLSLFHLDAMVCTLGGDGALYVSVKEEVFVAGLKVDIVDTVGAGDAFLAAFLSGYLNGLPASELMQHANALGAKVAGQKGAIASY